MKLSQHPHLDAEKLLHLLRLLGIRATYKPLCSVGISVAGTCGYFYDGALGYKPRVGRAVRVHPDLSISHGIQWVWATQHESSPEDML